MTQFPAQPPYQAYGIPQPIPAPVKWSGSSIAGFVLSFFGCSIIGGLLGIILGIVGILDCRGGRRRGLGLAISAIPISLISGGLGLMSAYGMFVFAKVASEVPKKVSAALTSADPTKAAEVIREFATVEFNDRVSNDELVIWLKLMEEKHGKLTGLEQNQFQPVIPGTPGTNIMKLNLNGKFVNGTVPVIVSVKFESFLHFRIDDIEVDAISPRDAARQID